MVKIRANFQISQIQATLKLSRNLKIWNFGELNPYYPLESIWDYYDDLEKI